MIWFIFVACMISAFLLAGIESALISVSRVRARHAADEGDRRAAKLTKLLDRRHDLLRASMVAHQFFFVASFVIFAEKCHRLLPVWGLMLATLVSPLFLLFIEMVPKLFFRAYPFRMLRRLIAPLHLLQIITTPWRFFIHRQGTATDADKSPARASGVSSIVNDLAALNLLQENAVGLLRRYEAFVPLAARDLMTPLSTASALPSDLPLTAAKNLAMQKSQRHHVVMDDEGEIIGSLDAAALPYDAPPDRLVRQFALPMIHLHEGDPAMRCLQTLRKTGARIALVYNGDKKPSGIITIRVMLDRLLNIPEKARRA